ncbi:kinase-like domain-containing protein [Chytridium lagenaria]|nr:kinase-like domain-containing protein [Chytridium lagenaria]
MASFNIHPSDVSLIREIGRGGMGSVFEANLANHGTVAVKTLKHATMDRRLIIQEAETMARLHHPSIVGFLGVVFDHPNFAFGIVIEYLPLGSLYDYYTKNPKLSVFDRLSLAADIARVLNVLLQVDGSRKLRGKITDFGLAEKHSGATTAAGTPAWMAPELQADKKLLFATDVYSFGVVLTELFSWRGPMAFDEQFKQLASDFSPVALQLVADCMDRNPSQRPEFEAVAKRLDALVADAAMIGGTMSTLASARTGSVRLNGTAASNYNSNGSGYGGLTPSLRTDSQGTRANFNSFNVNQSVLPGVPTPRFQSNAPAQNFATFNVNQSVMPQGGFDSRYSNATSNTAFSTPTQVPAQGYASQPSNPAAPVATGFAGQFNNGIQPYSNAPNASTAQAPKPASNGSNKKWIIIAIIVGIVVVAGAGVGVFLALRKSGDSSSSNSSAASSGTPGTGAPATTAGSGAPGSPAPAVTSAVPGASATTAGGGGASSPSPSHDNSVTLGDCGDAAKQFTIIAGNFGTLNIRHVPSGFCLDQAIATARELILSPCSLPLFYSRSLQNIYNFDTSGSPSSRLIV